jgi:hypothetical protein
MLADNLILFGQELPIPDFSIWIVGGAIVAFIIILIAVGFFREIKKK